jgi:CRP/FNR family transcriptional regulator, cyclic AMP receptor protein
VDGIPGRTFHSLTLIATTFFRSKSTRWRSQLPCPVFPATPAYQQSCYYTIVGRLAYDRCRIGFHFGTPIAPCAAVSAILAAVRSHPARTFSIGENVLIQGESTGLLYVLVAGAVEVIKDGVTVARATEPGAMFGDLSALLGVPHTASVRAVQESTFHVVANPREFLDHNSAACVQLCELLARRLDAVNKYLVDVKQQFAGHDHLGMVDDVLDTLMHRQPRKRVAPKASTLRDPEIAD